MDILLGSLHSLEDRRIFMKAQLLFWMLATIDGHAKNFSVFFHLAGGLYHLTPLYDVLSVHPLVATRQVDRRKKKSKDVLIFWLYGDIDFFVNNR